MCYNLYNDLRYEWDENKNRRNQRKHAGISFELAALVSRTMSALSALTAWATPANNDGMQ